MKSINKKLLLISILFIGLCVTSILGTTLFFTLAVGFCVGFVIAEKKQIAGYEID